MLKFCTTEVRRDGYNTRLCRGTGQGSRLSTLESLFTGDISCPRPTSPSIAKLHITLSYIIAPQMRRTGRKRLSQEFGFATQLGNSPIT
ncbi:hypothetical protein MESS4_p40079 [Mesorhizobium sp. STM 4661]|nr:hypothetical protein MESS4_p40079 [Mesorhizobium sp. STM 4661]